MKEEKLKVFTIFSFLALNSTMIGILLMVILVDIGERLGERFLPIYIMALGGGVIAVGFLNALDNFLSAIYSFIGGAVSERLGEKRALRGFNLLSILGFAIVVFVPRWQAVLVGAVFFISWSALSLPATMSLVSAVLPKTKHTMAVSMHSLVRRIPMALGPLIGGFFIDTYGALIGVRIAFCLAILMAVVALFLQEKLISEDHKAEKSDERLKSQELFALMSPGLKRLLVSDILVRFCEQIPYAFVVIWCLQLITSPVSATEFGVLTTIEMITAVLVYIPVAYFADRGQKKPFVVTTFIFFALFPLMLLLSQSFWLLVLAFIVRGLKEFGEPTRKALIMQFAPEGHKAGMFGLYYLLRDVTVAFATFAGAYVWRYNPAANLLLASFCGFAGAFYFWKGPKEQE